MKYSKNFTVLTGLFILGAFTAHFIRQALPTQEVLHDAPLDLNKNAKTIVKDARKAGQEMPSVLRFSA